MGYISRCHCEEYGFQALYSGIGYINRAVGSTTDYHFSRN